MKYFLTALVLTFSLNTSADTILIGSLLENQQVKEHIFAFSEKGYLLTSILDRKANEGIPAEDRQGGGNYLIKLKKIELIDTEEGDVEKKETVKKFTVITAFGRVQKIEEIVEQPETNNTDVVQPPVETEETN